MIYFYQPEISDGKTLLEGEEQQHCVKVLRKKAGDEIGILDGKGKSYTVRITKITGKECFFSIESEIQYEPKKFYNHIVIAPTKSPDRMEWFVEKACELGVDEVSFVRTQNSERNKLRTDRLEKKAISALKQSKSGFLTRISPLQTLSDKIGTLPAEAVKFIAVAEPGLPYYIKCIPEGRSVVTVIGPEGDFSPMEVGHALELGFEKVSLGQNILRTETAGIIAAHLVNVKNSY